jgi:hypothetical protein
LRNRPIAICKTIIRTRPRGSPDRVAQRIARHGPVGTQQQEGKQCQMPATLDGEALVAVVGLDRPESEKIRQPTAPWPGTVPAPVSAEAPQTILDPTFARYNIGPISNVNFGQVSWQDGPGGPHTGQATTPLDKAMRAAETIVGEQARATAWGNIDRMLTDTAAAVPWQFPKQPMIESSDVRGTGTRASGITTTPRYADAGSPRRRSSPRAVTHAVQAGRATAP